METRATKVAEWLNGIPKTKAHAVIVTIQGEEYPGARFTQKREHNGKPYDHFGIMLLGLLPPCYKRTRKVCFTFKGEQHEWYVAAHYQGEINDMQPHGPNFILAPWADKTGQLIDHYELKKYDRKEIVVRQLDRKREPAKT